MTFNAETAEALTSTILSNGEHLRDSFADNELHQFADVASDLFNSLSYQYSAFQQEHSLDLEDTANFSITFT